MMPQDKAWRARLRTPPAFDADALWAGVEARRGRRRNLKRVALALPVLAAAAAAVLFMRGAAKPELLVRADGGSLAHMQAGAAVVRVALSDGSQIELAPGARLDTRALTPQLFETAIDAGKVKFDVVPHGPRAWHIQAGTTQVRVLGTSFSVERRAAEVLVSVTRGSVQVSGPDVPNGSQQLQAGQTLHTHPQQPLAAGASSRAPEVPASALPATATDVVGPTHPTAAARDVEQALREADRARAQGQPERAARLLARLIAEHPKDTRAALAAFTLAELYLGPLASPLRAAATFERAQSLGLPAALAEQGAARIFEAYAAAGRAEPAATAARVYLSKYPAGSYRRAARRWAGEP